MPTPPCPPLSLVSPPPTAAWATSPHFFHLKRRRLQSRLLKPSCNAARGLGLGSGRSSCFHYMPSRSREIGIDMQPQASICSPSIQGGPESNAPHKFLCHKLSAWFIGPFSISKEPSTLVMSDLPCLWPCVVLTQHSMSSK